MARRVRREGEAGGPPRERDDAADAGAAQDRDLLRQRWRRVIGRAAPPGLGPRLMQRILIWREQIARVGDIDRPTRAKLAAALGETTEDTVRREKPNARLRVGTVLVREHQGTVHRVTVTHDGFMWRETTYRSLSALARAITGVSWNGRRFFGLKDEAGGQQRRPVRKAADSSSPSCPDAPP